MHRISLHVEYSAVKKAGKSFPEVTKALKQIQNEYYTEWVDFLKPEGFEEDV